MEGNGFFYTQYCSAYWFSYCFKDRPEQEHTVFNNKLRINTFMSLSPSQILLHIESNEFKVAENEIMEFIKFNVDTSNQLVVVNNHIFKHDLARQDDEINAIEILCNEYVEVISTLFCHSGYKPSNAMIGCLLGYKVALDWLFSASDSKNTDGIIERLGLIKLDSEGNFKLSTEPQDLIMTMTLISLGSKFRLPWKSLFHVNPAIALSSYIGLVTHPVPALSREYNIGFNHLLESAKDLPIFELPVLEDLGKLRFGYFNCSYATSSNKYEFKKWLTALIRHNIGQWLDDEVKLCISKISTIRSSEKPIVAVMLELYSKNHAMYRCFNALLLTLRKDYRLVAFISKDEVETSDLSAFDEVITFNGVFDINNNVKRVVNLKPDIIFYPSIGMKFWGVYLSQLRLAPIQVMMGGHPSSSFSPVVDYFFIHRNTYSANEIQFLFSEKVICPSEFTKEHSTHIKDDHLTDNFINKHNAFLENKDEIKVGINGILTKVTFDIISVCKEIEKKSNKKIIFVFFSSHKSNQLAYLSSKKQLEREINYIELSSYSDYISYMKIISSCDFLLPTLPFGGTNSNIDAMVLHKPKLFVKGKTYLYTRCDHEEWARVGLEDELGCNSHEELIEKSLRLIEDNEYRKEIHKKMVAKCTLNRVFKPIEEDNNLLTILFSNMLSDYRQNLIIK